MVLNVCANYLLKTFQIFQLQKLIPGTSCFCSCKVGLLDASKLFYSSVKISHILHKIQRNFTQRPKITELKTINEIFSRLKTFLINKHANVLAKIGRKFCKSEIIFELRCYANEKIIFSLGGLVNWTEKLFWFIVYWSSSFQRDEISFNDRCFFSPFSCFLSGFVEIGNYWKLLKIAMIICWLCKHMEIRVIPILSDQLR